MLLELAAAAILSGWVTWVRDADTIEVENLAVRLQGVAGPELDEPYGQAARGTMRVIAEGRWAECSLTGEVSHDRVVGTCVIDGRDIGAVIIGLGMARDCFAFSGGRYADLETATSRQHALPDYCLP